MMSRRRAGAIYFYFCMGATEVGLNIFSQFQHWALGCPRFVNSGCPRCGHFSKIHCCR
jgi:hypothetical protein